MSDFGRLIRTNPNYRRTWTGQVVSEIGDHFNNIAVMSLAMERGNAGLVVTGVFLSRAVAMLGAGPIAGVLLDRLDRRRVMIASDLVRAVIALSFIFCVDYKSNWLLFGLSAVLMFASPFFSGGRAAVLPSIATADELHTAGTMTQTTSWASLTVGAFLGAVVVKSGFAIAFGFNALSFLVSAACIARLHHADGRGFRVLQSASKRSKTGFRQFRDGLAYMRSTPLLSGVSVVTIGWAAGGGAAQILFSLFGEKVFKAGPYGIGLIWGCAGIGLLCGGAVGYQLGKRLNFVQYKRTIAIVYVIHGGAYVLFSQMPTMAWACVFIAVSRAAVAVSSVLNYTQLMRHVEDRFRGRVFATLESLTWSTMMISMMATGAVSVSWNPRTIGMVSGIVSSMTALVWTWLNISGRLPEPPEVGELALQEAESVHAIA